MLLFFIESQQSMVAESLGSEQGLANIFRKEPEVSLTTTRFCCCEARATRDNS